MDVPRVPAAHRPRLGRRRIDDRAVVAVVRRRRVQEDTAADAAMVESAEAAYAEACPMLREARGRHVQAGAGRHGGHGVWVCLGWQAAHGPWRPGQARPGCRGHLACPDGRQARWSSPPAPCGAVGTPSVVSTSLSVPLGVSLPIRRSSQSWVVAPIPVAVRDELFLRCLFVLDVQTPLYAVLFPVVAATDASLHSGAVVEAQCSLEEVAWLWTRASTRASYSSAALSGRLNPGGHLVPADDAMQGGGRLCVREATACNFTRAPSA